MDPSGESSPPLENTQTSHSCQCSSCPGSFPMRMPMKMPPIELIINVRQIPPIVEPAPQPAPHQLLTPQREVNQDKEGIFCNVQGRILRLKERFRVRLNGIYPRKLDKEETENFCCCEKKENLLSLQEDMELYTPEGKELSMEKMQLRSKPLREGLYSKEWTKRLSDYTFLSGKDEDLPKRSTQVSQKVKRTNRRATVMLPQVTVKSNNQVCSLSPLCHGIQGCHFSSSGCYILITFIAL